MKVIQANDLNKLELPLQFSISFHKVFSMYEKYASAEFEKHPFHNSAKIMLKEMADVPELIEGFSDFKLLEKHQEKIELLLKPLFPESLLLNEIKAASIPFSFTSFMFTTRFEDIINDAGKDFKLRIRNFDDDLFYIHACIMILSSVYNYSIDLKRPFFFDIPDKNGEIKNYRVAFNGDLGEIIPTKNAPKITEDDIEDIQQDIFCIVWPSLENFDGKKSCQHTYITCLVERAQTSIIRKRPAQKRTLVHM
ncbi:MAG: hypothetical protein HRT73_14595, partial [Flavobacteriales bacterium]|nr:hypothetical protein [Flavobacteriales bacterium]